MIHNASNLYLRAFLLLVVLTAMAVAPQGALANVRYTGGGDVPFYARIERGITYTDGEWVTVVFYRPPGCIPCNFNLLDFFDFANAWSCLPPTTDGFSVWGDGTAPVQQDLHGLGAVPVWFVSLVDYQLAVADDVLTIGELASLPSLKIGSASFYQETLHPLGGALRDHLEYNAHGTFADGASFRAHVVFTEANLNVSIMFGH
jgi:hypothetical protein